MSPRCRKIVSHGKESCGRFNPRNVTAAHCQELIIESICVITLVIGFIIFSLFYLLTQLSSRSTPSNSMPTRRHRSRIRNIDNHSRSNSESKITPVSAAGSTRDYQLRRERSSSFDRRQRVNQSPRDSINEELQNFKRNKWKSLVEQSFNGKNDQMRYIGMSPSESLENIAEENMQLQTDSTNPQLTITDTENAITKLDETKEFASENESSRNKMSLKHHKELESNAFGRNIKTNSLTTNLDIISSDPNKIILSPTQANNVKTDVQVPTIRPRSPKLNYDNNEESLPDNLPSVMKENNEQKVYDNTKANSIQRILSPPETNNAGTNEHVSYSSPRSPRISKDNNEEGLSGAKDNLLDLTKQKTEQKVYDDLNMNPIQLREDKNDIIQIISSNAKLNKVKAENDKLVGEHITTLEKENESVSITKDAVNFKTPKTSDLNSIKESNNNDNVPSTNVVGPIFIKGSNEQELPITKEIYSNDNNINSKKKTTTKDLVSSSNEIKEEATSSDLNVNNLKHLESQMFLEAVKKLQDSLVNLPVDSNKLQKSSAQDNHKIENKNITGEINKENNVITQPANPAGQELEKTEHARENNNYNSNVNHNEVEDFTDNINNIRRQNTNFSKSSKINPKSAIDNQHEISDKKNKEVINEMKLKNTSENTHFKELNRNYKANKTKSNKPDNETTQEMEPSHANLEYIYTKRHGNHQSLKEDTDLENQGYDNKNNHKIALNHNEVEESTDIINNTPNLQFIKASKIPKTGIKFERKQVSSDKKADVSMYETTETPKVKVNDENYTAELSHLNEHNNNHKNKINAFEENEVNNVPTQQIEPLNPSSEHSSIKRNGNHLQVEKGPDQEERENGYGNIILKSATKNNKLDPIDLFHDKHSEKILNDTSASQNILFSDEQYENANYKSEPIVNKFKNLKNQEHNQDLPIKIKKGSFYKPSNNHEQDGSLKDLINNKQKGHYSKSSKVITKAGIEMEKYQQNDQETDKTLSTSSGKAKTQVNGHLDTNNKQSLQKLSKSNSLCRCDDNESKNSKRGESNRKEIYPTDSKPLHSKKNISIDKDDNPSEFKYKIKNESNKKLHQSVSDHDCGCSTIRSSKVLADKVQKFYTKSTQPPFSKLDRVAGKHEEEQVRYSKDSRNSNDLCGCDNFQYPLQSTNKAVKTHLKASTIDTQQTYAKATKPPSAKIYQDNSQSKDKYKSKQELWGNCKSNISDDLCKCEDSHSMQQPRVQLSPTISYTHQSKQELEKAKQGIKQESLKKSTSHISTDLCKCDDVNKLKQPSDQSHPKVSSAQVLQKGIKNGRHNQETEGSHINNGLCVCNETQNLEPSLHEPFQKINSKLDDTMRIKDEKYNLPAGGCKPQCESVMESEALQEKITQQDIDGLCACANMSDPEKCKLTTPSKYGKAIKLPLSQMKIKKEEMQGLGEASSPQSIFSKSTKPPFLRDRKERVEPNNPLHYIPESYKLRETRSQKSIGMRSQKSIASMKKSQNQIRGMLSAQNSSHSPKIIRGPLQDMLQSKPCNSSDGRIIKAQFGKNIGKLKAERQRQSLNNAEKSEFKTENPNLVTGCSKDCLGILGQISKEQLKYFKDLLSKGASHKDKIYSRGTESKITQPQTQLNKSQLERQNTSESISRLPQTDSLLDCDRCRSEDVRRSYSNNTTIPMSTTATEDTFAREIIAASTPHTSATALDKCNKADCKELLKKPFQK